ATLVGDAVVLVDAGVHHLHREPARSQPLDRGRDEPAREMLVLARVRRREDDHFQNSVGFPEMARSSCDRYLYRGGRCCPRTPLPPNAAAGSSRSSPRSRATAPPRTTSRRRPCSKPGATATRCTIRTGSTAGSQRSRAKSAGAGAAPEGA